MLQMAPMLNFLLSSGSKKKEPRYVCLSEAKASLRHKTWVTTGFKKVLRYTIHFSQKSQQTNPLPGSPKGPYREGGPPTGNFAYPSRKKNLFFQVHRWKETSLRPPLRSLLRKQCPIPEHLHAALKVPGRWALLQVPQKRSPCAKRCPSPEPFLNILQGPCWGSPPSRFPSQSSQGERHCISWALLSHFSESW